jgi:hypothetical protein
VDHSIEFGSGYGSGSSNSSESGSGSIPESGFDDQKLKKNTDLMKNCSLLMSKLQEKPSALKREQQHLKKKLF